MRVHFFIFVGYTLLTLLGSFSPRVQAAENAIRVTGIAQTEVEVTNSKGEKTLKRTPVDKAVPGTEVIYTTQFKNIIATTASNIVIDNPIPTNTEYKADSAFGANCDIHFSVDGGKEYARAEDLQVKDKGKERIALPAEYTHIRWIYRGQLSAGQSSEVGFRSIIK